MENYSLLDNILEMSEQTLNITQNEALCVFGVKLVTRLSASNEDALFQSSIAKHHENLFPVHIPYLKQKWYFLYI